MLLSLTNKGPLAIKCKKKEVLRGGLSWLASTRKGEIERLKKKGFVSFFLTVSEKQRRKAFFFVVG